jgi:hypothetical protein
MKLLFATDENTFDLDFMRGVPCLRDIFTKKTYMSFERYMLLSLHISTFTGRHLLDIRSVPNLKWNVTGHGELRSYFHRFKIIDDPTCLCKKSPQTADHLLWECELLRKQRQVLRDSIMK